MSIRTDAQRLDVGAVVALFTLDATAAGGQVHRFVTGPWNGAAVDYGGVAYTPAPIELEGVKYGGDGPLPRPRLRMSRLDSTVASAVVDADDWRGAKLTRVRTLTRYLDGEPDADPTRHWPAEIWLIERLARATRAEVVWQLASPIDLDRRKLPGRQVLKDVCAWRYRHWTGSAWDYAGAECPYTGSGYYDVDDNAATDAADDVCSRRLSGCKARFPANDLPFGGFLGVGRTRAG